MKKSLMVLANVNEYNNTERGVNFTFENSLKCNYCNIIEYHDKYIIEFRKKTDDIIQGKQNKLVYEDIIPRENLQETFENITGIYISYLDT